MSQHTVLLWLTLFYNTRMHLNCTCRYLLQVNKILSYLRRYMDSKAKETGFAHTLSEAVYYPLSTTKHAYFLPSHFSSAIKYRLELPREVIPNKYLYDQWRAHTALNVPVAAEMHARTENLFATFLLTRQYRGAVWIWKSICACRSCIAGCIAACSWDT